MKKTFKLTSLLLAILCLLTSCQTVYEASMTTPETTVNPDIDIDLEGEYYTLGGPYRTGDISRGMIYEGCLIYIEKCVTKGVTGEKTNSDGTKVPVYGNVKLHRIVKYNPVTGTASSPCRIPTCNHSLESGCPMLLGSGFSEGQVESYAFQGIFGDWLVYMKFNYDNEYGSIMTEIMCNLKTGEVRNTFVEKYETNVVSKWRGGWYMDGKYYKVNSILDYSNSGYKPGMGLPLSFYEPDTKQYMYEYDFETNESKKLFEVTDICLGFMATSERFYFDRDDGTRYSTLKDGTDKRTETARSSSNFIGTYSILYKDNGFSIYDLKTDESKEVSIDLLMAGKMCVTDNGVLYAHQTKEEEMQAFAKEANEYRLEHPEEPPQDPRPTMTKILASGTAQIWGCGFFGEDNRVIFELPNAHIEIISAYDDYVFAILTKYDAEKGAPLDGYDSISCSINIKTGEITPIPELEIVVPYWYVN